jgi:adenylate kinase
VRVFVMVGAPGAGKGTQAVLIAERLGLIQVASGDLFREAVRDETPLGADAKCYMERGALVPDDIVIGMIDERLSRSDARGGIVLDGFPRTRPQAEALDALLRRRGDAVEGALYVGVSEPELLRRLSGRWLCRSAGHPYHEVSRPPRTPGRCDIDGSELCQRDDDRPETVRARLEQQLPPMYDVIDYYKGTGVLVAVDGEQPVDVVNDALLKAVNAQPAGRAR